jgi:oligo-1,6-glucosidase
MTNMSFGAISDYRDIEVLNHHREATTHLGHTDAEVLAALAPLNRDNARTPVQWDATRNAGFTTGSPWIAVNPNASSINAAAQVDDPGSVFNFYREVIALRHRDPVVSRGDFTMLLPEDEQVYAFSRALPDAGMLVLGNFSSDECIADVGDESWAAAEQVLANYPVEKSLRLRPWELKVFRRGL